MELDKKAIKELVYLYELNNSGMRKLNGGDVKVLNLHIAKKEKRVYADIILIRLENDSYVEERYNECHYSFKLLGLEKNGLEG